MNRREAVREKLTPEFIETLVELAKVIGWDVPDYWEVRAFIKEVHDFANIKELPDLDPYEDAGLEDVI